MEKTIAANVVALRHLGLRNSRVHYQAGPDELVEQTLVRGQGQLSSSGALSISTGFFTGRSPQDKFIVKDETTAHKVHWNNLNVPIDAAHFVRLRQKMTNYLNGRPEIWVRDCFACAHPSYRLRLRVINENAWSNLFAHNLFLRPEPEDLRRFEPEWILMHAPGFEADPETDGTRSRHFALISFSHKMILIGGTGYTGEMKKAVFTILNFILPEQHQVLSMHCSANMGRYGDSAIFFGLSGTGKTTLSADPERSLIGDDEHGWCNEGIFNFEGGCYAKCIDLSPAKEPQIFQAIRPGALLENIGFLPGTNDVDYACKSTTENTRVSYPLHYIQNAVIPSVGPAPSHIFFLSCDARGILPPISRLTPGQAMYYFISGYTARVAGTEAGILEPKSTFSACFGAPFMPLHPGRYAQLLGQKMRQHHAKVWLINTGWTGGAYGTGKRLPLAHTRAMIAAVLDGAFDKTPFGSLPVFNLAIPLSCPGVPDQLLNPANTWKDPLLYMTKARELAAEFNSNFQKYAGGVSGEIIAAAPALDL
jgi:phosphoenolpyruvate carboxykinase (ATP)